MRSKPEGSPATPSTAHFEAVLKADGLARAIGLSADGTEDPNSIWKHILWLAALESGGSISHEGNILGSKVRFSGGAVITYAIFTLDGTLGCSGNVFDFEGSVRPKEFATSFHKPGTAPKRQLGTVRGTCSPAK